MECKGKRADQNDCSEYVLIETLWNVKCPAESSVPVLRYSINRNIVECKDLTRQSHKQALFVLIETLWNVKTLTTSSAVATTGVLIETLWNVKNAESFLPFVPHSY